MRTTTFRGISFSGKGPQSAWTSPPSKPKPSTSSSSSSRVPPPKQPTGPAPAGSGAYGSGAYGQAPCLEGMGRAPPRFCHPSVSTSTAAIATRIAPVLVSTNAASAGYLPAAEAHSVSLQGGGLGGRGTPEKTSSGSAQIPFKWHQQADTGRRAFAQGASRVSLPLSQNTLRGTRGRSRLVAPANQ